jgi:putative transposase
MPRRSRRHDLAVAVAVAVAVAELREQLRRSERENRVLRRENEILREVAEPLIHCAPARERFAFIHARRGRFGAKLLCRVLVTDGANYRAWVCGKAKRQDRTCSDEQLARLIVEVHTAHSAYGAVRVTRELKHQGVEVGRHRVARLMRENGIVGITRRKRRNLTKPGPGAAAAPDLIRREFTAPMPGLKLIGDITCFPTSEGWLYLAAAVDLCSKELIGYAIAPHMRASLAVDAIAAAHRTGLMAGNAIMHTDRGSRYHSKLYHDVLRRLDIRQSTSRTGSFLDGAAAESFFAALKTEIGIDTWPDRASARRDVENWIKLYNERRLHSALGYQTPVESRTAWQQRMSTAA